VSTAAKRRTGVVMTVVIALIAGGMLVAFVVSQSSKPGTKVSLGSSEVFDAGSAKGLAKQISDGGPIQFARASTRGPDIYLQHLGTDPATGWHAFVLQAAGQDRRCSLQWQPAARQFLDPCTQQMYPADGAGLQQFKTAVDANGHLTVDFRS
jgi:hypothetical protein